MDVLDPFRSAICSLCCFHVYSDDETKHAPKIGQEKTGLDWTGQQTKKEIKPYADLRPREHEDILMNWSDIRDSSHCRNLCSNPGPSSYYFSAFPYAQTTDHYCDCVCLLSPVLYARII